MSQNMLKADSASVAWNADKKRWDVRIQVGEEVIRRPLLGTAEQDDASSLKSKAVETAAEEGYTLDASRVTVEGGTKRAA
jgi:hypothetical protein